MGAGFSRPLAASIRQLTSVDHRIYGFPEDYWDAYPAKIMAVTADDVQRIAEKYLNPDTLQIVAVGDRKTIQAALEKFGPVEVYDSEGRPAAVKTSSANR